MKVMVNICEATSDIALLEFFKWARVVEGNEPAISMNPADVERLYGKEGPAEDDLATERAQRFAEQERAQVPVTAQDYRVVPFQCRSTPAPATAGRRGRPRKNKDVSVTNPQGSAAAAPAGQASVSPVHVSAAPNPADPMSAVFSVAKGEMVAPILPTVHVTPSPQLPNGPVEPPAAGNGIMPLDAFRAAFTEFNRVRPAFAMNVMRQPVFSDGTAHPPWWTLEAVPETLREKVIDEIQARLG